MDDSMGNVYLGRQKLNAIIQFYQMTSIRRNLADYLLKCNTFELMAEKLREKIAQNGYLQIETVFQRLDSFRKGYLVPDDLSQFMLQNKIYPTDLELYLIFRDFDTDRAGVLTLRNLSQHLLPKQNMKLQKQALGRKYYPCEGRLQIDLEFLIARYFEHKIKQIKQLARMRLEMHEKQPLAVEEAFTLLDIERKGMISSLADIDRFLRNNGKVASKDELVRIFRVLSFDRDPSVLYETFQEHLDPLGKGYYIGYSQRIAQKQARQQDFLRHKLQLNSQLLRSSRNRANLTDTIANLQDQNHRLAGLLQSQSEEQRQYEQQLLACRIRRNLF